MTSEEIKAIVYYIQGLQALWKEGYNAEKVGDYTFNFICRDFRDYNTTNELWEVINELQFMGEGEEWEKTKEEVFDLLKQTLRPEFLNRIDETVLFQPLNYNEIGKIVQFQLRGINKMLESRNIILTATQEAIDFILKKGYDPAFGARPLKRVVQQEVLNKLSKEILAGNVKEGERVTVDCFDNKLVFRPTE